MRVGDCEGKGVGGVVLGELVEREERLDHALNLDLLREAVAAHRHLHAARLVLVHGHVGFRRRHDHGAARLAEDEHRAGVLAVDDAFDGEDVRRVARDQLRDARMDRAEAVRKRQLRVVLDASRLERAHPRALDGEHAVAA